MKSTIPVRLVSPTERQGKGLLGVRYQMEKGGGEEERRRT